MRQPTTVLVHMHLEASRKYYNVKPWSIVSILHIIPTSGTESLNFLGFVDKMMKETTESDYKICPHRFSIDIAQISCRH